MINQPRPPRGSKLSVCAFRKKKKQKKPGYLVIFENVGPGNWGINGKENQQNGPHLGNTADTPWESDVAGDDRRPARRQPRPDRLLRHGSGRRGAPRPRPRRGVPHWAPACGVNFRRPERGGTSGSATQFRTRRKCPLRKRSKIPAASRSRPMSCSADSEAKSR